MDQEIKATLVQDEKMRFLIQKHGSPQPGVVQDIYPYLVESIIYQQLSIKAAAKIFERFIQLNGHFPDPAELLELTPEQMRSAGISGQKAGYLHHIARHFSMEAVQSIQWDQLDDEEITRQLTGIKGVGRWTAKMVLMFGLHRPDVFPFEDLGIQIGMKKIYDIQEEGKEFITKICNIAEAWRPYRSFGSKLIWAHKDSKMV
jgi:DNA-3-methyladenine glycosylase II